MLGGVHRGGHGLLELGLVRRARVRVVDGVVVRVGGGLAGELLVRGGHREGSVSVYRGCRVRCRWVDRGLDGETSV